MKLVSHRYCLYLHYGHGVFLFRDLSLFAQDTWHVNSRLNLTYGLRWEINFAPKTETGLPIPSLTGFSLTNLSNLALGLWQGRPSAPATEISRHASVEPTEYRRTRTGGLFCAVGSGSFTVCPAPRSATWILDRPITHSLSESIYSNIPFPESARQSEPAARLHLPIFRTETVLPDSIPISTYRMRWSGMSLWSSPWAVHRHLPCLTSAPRISEPWNPKSSPTPIRTMLLLTLIAGTGYFELRRIASAVSTAADKGLQALVSYSWSHAIDTGSYGAYSNGSFANVNANRGDSDYDLRNVFTAAMTYSRARMEEQSAHAGDHRRMVHGRRSANSHRSSGRCSGCQFYSLSQLISFDPDSPRCRSGAGGVSDGSQYPGGKALNPASFTDPPVDPTTGDPIRARETLGRNARRALGLSQWDFAARREFPIYERLKLQFRAELFNILNHPNFGPFNNTFQSGNAFFGQATQTLNQSWAAWPVSEARTRSIRPAVRVPASWR